MHSEAICCAPRASTKRRSSWRAIPILLSLLVATPAVGQTIPTPDVSGDQLLFLYDARTDRVPFLSISNPSDATVFVEVAFYPADLSSRLGSAVIELGSAANEVIDPTSFAGGVANGNAGLAVMTPDDQPQRFAHTTFFLADERRIELPDGLPLSDDPNGNRAAVTLADYRALYRQYRRDAQLQRAHQLSAGIVARLLRGVEQHVRVQAERADFLGIRGRIFA